MRKAKWLRKAVKRKLKEKDKGIVDFIWIMRHFFGHLRDWIEEMEDPCHPGYTIYTQSDLVFMGLMKNICSVESMRQMEERFNEETCIDTLRLLSGHAGLEEMPHYDTLNTYLSKLSPGCLSELRKRMIVSLLRGEQFYRGRLLGKYWRVILDGTGLFYFKERHCANCLSETRKKEDGRTEKGHYHGASSAGAYQTGISPFENLPAGGRTVRGGANHETVPGKWVVLCADAKSEPSKDSRGSV